MSDRLMVISTDADEPPGQHYSAGVVEDLDWTCDDADPESAASNLKAGAIRAYLTGSRAL
jgi:hypothetical protein